jgi:hypothetical protein
MKEEWRKRYERRFDGYRLPTSSAKREELAVAIGEDGFYLLQAIHSETCPPELKHHRKWSYSKGSGSNNITGVKARSIGGRRKNGANLPPGK